MRPTLETTLTAPCLRCARSAPSLIAATLAGSSVAARRYASSAAEASPIFASASPSPSSPVDVFFGVDGAAIGVAGRTMIAEPRGDLAEPAMSRGPRLDLGALRGFAKRAGRDLVITGDQGDLAAWTTRSRRSPSPRQER